MPKKAAKNLMILNDIFCKGGVERVISYLSLLPLQENIRKSIVLFDGEKIDFQHDGAIIDLNLNVAPYKSYGHEIITLIQGVFKLWREKLKAGQSICVSHKEGPNFLNVLTGVSKTIVTVHEHKSSGMRNHRHFDKIIRLLIKRLYNRADIVVAVSAGIKKDLCDNFGVKENKIQIIYNGCDLEAISALAHEPIEESLAAYFAGPVIITAGRLERQKGHWHLIRAFNDVKKSITNAKLLILGEGSEKPYLKKMVSALNLEQDVLFLGFQSNPFKFFSKSSVFVLSSLWEGFSLVLLEAMACQKPIISTDCLTGPRELLAPGTEGKDLSEVEYANFGVLTPRCDGLYKKPEEALTREEKLLSLSIVSLLASQELQETYSAAAYRRVREFDMSRFHREWTDLIESAWNRE